MSATLNYRKSDDDVLSADSVGRQPECEERVEDVVIWMDKGGPG